MKLLTYLKSKKTLTPIIIGFCGLAVVIIFYFIDPQITQAVLGSTLRQSTPIILGALCGIMCERSGVINIGIEGQMLMSAFVGFMANAWTGNLFFAVMAGMATGALLGLLLAFTSVTLKLDQIIGGTVINILATGLTGYFYQAGITTEGKLSTITLGALAEIPLIGPVLFNNPPITYAAIILVFVLQFVLFKTTWGLRMRSVGEHPRAADTVGINVFTTRYINVILGGAIAGLAGAFLTLEAVGSFERMMTNGRGFVALAVMIFGKWTPIGAWGASLLFGFANAMQTQFQFMGTFAIPHQFIGMLPYLLTIIVLAGFGGRARPPAAEGEPYEKE
ncbi:MAG: ABC transporter permease [Chloroflexota bacterium]|jgi:simple sugar transport system permease protein|nr:ABC transporter permease [Chloroflexota bacterium]